MSENKFYAVIWCLDLCCRSAEGRESCPVPITLEGGGRGEVIFGSKHLSIVQTDLRCDTAAGPNTRSRIRLLIPKLLHGARCQSLTNIDPVQASLTCYVRECSHGCGF